MKIHYLPLLAILFFCACAQKPVIKEQPEGTRKMVARLAEITTKFNADFEHNAFNNNYRAEKFRQQIPQGTTQAQRIQLGINMNTELLNAGRNQEAINGFLAMLTLVGNDNGRIDDRSKYMYHQLAVAYLRLGEQENCIINHTANSCILPIQKDAIHAKKLGSQKAIEVYKVILKKYPDDLAAQWLLNVAYMTLGEEEQVPEAWKLPAGTFKPTGKFPHFNNIATDLGLDVDDHAGGVCTEDFNNDGLMDLMLSGMGVMDQLRYFENNGEGGYTEKTEEAGLIGLYGGLNMNHADYNNDGYADVLVLRGGWMGITGCYPKSLLKNNGDGTFEDVSFAAGLVSEHPTQCAAWADANLDGNIDLFIGNESANGEFSDCEFYFNNGDGTFTESAAIVGLNFRAFAKSSVFGDVNRDGLPDLFVGTLGSDNRLYINKGGTDRQHWKFEESGTRSGVQKPLFTFPTFFFDYDNDGYEDLFACSYDISKFEIAEHAVIDIKGLTPRVETLRMYHNRGDGTFEDATVSTGMSRVYYGMSVNFGDLDNDGFLDFYIGTGNPNFQSIVPNKMFRNVDGKRFEDVTTDGGFGHIQKGHGIAFSDMDNDGDQDVYAQMGGAYEGDNFRNALYENPGNSNHWITLQLKGKQNRSALGAFVQLTITEDGKQRQIWRRVTTGGSFGSGSLQLEIGISKATVVDEIRVFWPNAAKSEQVYKNIKSKQKYLLEEGVAQAKVVSYKPFKWVKKEHMDHADMSTP